MKKYSRKTVKDQRKYWMDKKPQKIDVGIRSNTVKYYKMISKD